MFQQPKQLGMQAVAALSGYAVQSTGLFGSGAEAFVRPGFEVGGSRRRVRR